MNYESTTDIVEDCEVRDAAGDIVGYTADGDRADEPGDWYSCYPFFWYGNRIRNRIVGDCDWMNGDRPSDGSPCFWYGRREWEYVGVVYDVCNNWAIKAISSLVLKVEGTPPFGGGVDLGGFSRM